MRKKSNKRVTVLFAGVLIVIAAIAVGIWEKSKNNEPSEYISGIENIQTQTKQETLKDSHAGMAQSVVSGKWIDKTLAKNVPVAVMYSNVLQAMPQSSISKADIVFESLVEGGITRLCCVFENQPQLEKIGPVRSCRTYYLLFAKEFEAQYVHFGYSEYAKEYLSMPSFHGLDGMVYCNFYRTEDRIAPHNAYTSWKGIMDSAAVKGYEKVYPGNFIKPFTFNSEENKEIQLADGLECDYFSPGYPYNKPWFEYDASKKEYLRFQFEEAQIDKETNEQLSFKNILVKYVEPAYYENGTPDYKIYGEGKGLYITNGKAVSVTWKKESETEGPTKYYYSDGTEIVLNQGKTFICQVETASNTELYGKEAVNE